MFKKSLNSFLLLAVLTAAGTISMAQTDPNLKAATDVLDVYTKKAKPEILTLFDMSGSMNAVMWHPNYYTNANQTIHYGDGSADPDAATALNQHIAVAAEFTSPSTGSPITLPNGQDGHQLTAGQLGSCGDDDNIVFQWNNTNSPVLYAHRARGNKAHPGITWNNSYNTSMPKSDFQQWLQITGILIKPDGTPIVAPSGTTPLSSYSDQNYSDMLRLASHVRVRATCSLGGTSTTRIVDLPLPWKIWDTTVRYGLDGSTSGIIGENAPQPETVHDPVQDANIKADCTNVYDPNTGSGSNTGTIVGTRSWSSVSFTHAATINMFYNTDYCFWILFGKTVRNSAGNGEVWNAGNAFVIPSVTISGGSDNKRVDYWTSTGGKQGFSNGLPCITRYQALKYAVLTAWFTNQKDVYWAFRFLDGSAPTSTNNWAGSHQSLRLFKSATGTTSSDTNAAVKELQTTVPDTGTPMTGAVAQCYAQLTATDLQSIFNVDTPGGSTPGKKDREPSGCNKTFFIVFTDGMADDGPASGDPYSAVSSSNSAGDVDPTVGANSLNNGGANYNIWTMAATAAHGQHTGSSSIAALAPWKITGRGADAEHYRRIQTMTVGISLGGTINSLNGGHGPLYKAALYGNPTAKYPGQPTDTPLNRTKSQAKWTNGAPPFDPDIRTWTDGTNTYPMDPDSNPLFFPVNSPLKMADSLSAILQLVSSATSASSAPAAPLVGYRLSGAAYFGIFRTLKYQQGGFWAGDLLMAGVSQTANSVSLVGSGGNVIDYNTETLTSNNAVWSANNALRSMGWNTRKIWTRLPGRSLPLTFDSTASSSAEAFIESNADLMGACSDVPGYVSGSPGTSDSTSFKTLIRFYRGGVYDKNAVQNNTTTDNRDSMMGDVISSSPGVLQYELGSAPTGLTGSSSGWTNQAYRVIFVGDNQGHFHAFGEVSGMNGTIFSATATELWSFFAPDFLPTLNQQYSNGKHIYMVDGAPYVFVKKAKGSQDGRVVSGDTAYVVIGLGKGGRSYYVFDVTDPLKPKLVWNIRPDQISSSTTDANLKAILSMGLATATPSIGKVQVTSGSTTSAVDMLFLGGGLSTPEIDTAKGKALGRSVLAFNIKGSEDASGNPPVYKVWDFVNDTTLKNAFNSSSAMGPIVAAPAPLEFYVGTFLTQRVYFADKGGGVYALGSTSTNASTHFRLDNSDIANWGVRKIYQAPAGNAIVVPPAVFLPSNGKYPLAACYDATNKLVTSPLAAALVIVTGDKNNPMDSSLGIVPSGANGTGSNRLALVYDRQDSANLTVRNLADTASVALDSNGITEANLTDLTSVSSGTDAKITYCSNFSDICAGTAATPECTYYLKNGDATSQRLGYVLKFKTGATGGSPTAPYYEKASVPPIVVENVLFFSTFLPSVSAGSTTCSGGTTNSYRLCNVFAPTYNTGGTDLSSSASTWDSSNCSGKVFTFNGIASDLVALGSYGVIQAGSPATTTSSSTDPGIDIKEAAGNPSANYLKPRGWRIVR